MNINTHENVSVKKDILTKPKSTKYTLSYGSSYDYYYNCNPIYESQFIDILKNKELCKKSKMCKLQEDNQKHTKRKPLLLDRNFFCRLKSLFSN